MNNIYNKLIYINLIILLIQLDVSSQTFSSVFHEYDDFPSIDEIIHGDYNNDGNIDFIITGNAIGVVRIGLGNGISKPEFIDIENDLNVFNLSPIDFNSDGNIDFVGSAPFEDEAFVWINDGLGQFSRENLSISDYDAIHFADINNDGSTNVVVGIDDQIRIYELIQGELTLNKTIFDDTFAGSAGSISTVDFDMDGNMDIIATLSRDGLILFRQENNFDFIEEVLFSETFNDNDLHFSDLNEDGNLDFIVQSNFERGSTILMSTPTMEYNEIEIPRMYGENFYTQVVDIDNDGQAEIIHADGDSPFNAGFSIFTYNNLTEELEQEILAEDHNDTEDGGIADIDGDGDLDIYIYTNDLFDSGLAFYLQEGAVDLDGDGFNSDVDCDDSNENVNPGQVEIPYNGLDDDCDTATLDDDLDQDGFISADDCDDNNSDINPNQLEEPYNGIDDDCNAATLDDDLDQDGFLMADDCDDNNSGINPDAEEIANNGIDEDCDGIDFISATHELANTTISIYPNPAIDIINVDVEGQLSFSLKLYDLNGQLIKSNSNKNAIVVSALPKGTYLLEIQDLNSGQKIVERIVVGH